MAESEPSAAPAPGPDAPRGVAGFLRHYLIAVQFFTRLPVTGRLADWVGFSPAMLRASAAHFPGVGLLVGGLLGAALALLLAGLPPVPASAWVAAVAVSVAGALLTGAFHEDGLADLADGLGGSLDRERALEIMKDSRIGSYGALALLLVTGLRATLLAVLIEQGAGLAFAAWLAVQAWARWSPLWVMARLPYAGDAEHAKAKPLATGVGARQPWLALPLALLVLLPLAGLGAPQALFVPLVAGAVGLLMVGWLRRRLGGYTGDTLGATEQLAELALLLLLAAT